MDSSSIIKGCNLHPFIVLFNLYKLFKMMFYLLIFI
nr:MAG TPA: hypothetical protein [Bacteriophage sp.]